jgi:hypothetical protein
MINYYFRTTMFNLSYVRGCRKMHVWDSTSSTGTSLTTNVLDNYLGDSFLKNFKLCWLSSLPILSVPDEGYSRNASCALNLISTLYYPSLPLYLPADSINRPASNFAWAELDLSVINDTVTRKQCWMSEVTGFGRDKGFVLAKGVKEIFSDHNV